ncbi:MAG: NAD(P)/FAD-dependent oxidoreductase [Clostridia bacterium]|nr:NAD(P)/FAD-dependent oxidoreductase [Clostridia bacterium]
MYDVVIIGAGVVGSMMARLLSAFELSVCVLEKENDVSNGATKANSGIVHAGFDAAEGTLKAKLNVRGSQMMPKICKELGVDYKNNGSLVIGFCDEDKNTLLQLFQRGQKNGVKGLEILDRDALFKKEPNVSHNAICALWAPTGAIVSPYELAIAAMGNAMDNGVRLKLDFEVKSIKKECEAYSISSDEETVLARYVINAAGVFADKVAKMIGDNSFKIHARRGEYVLLDSECGNTVSHTIFTTPTKMGKGILVSPTVHNNLLLGPTSEDIEDKEDKSTTQKGLFNVIMSAEKSVDNIPRNKTITSFCGLRAVGDTGDFIINSPVKGFINLAGIESPGLSASPAIAEYALTMLKNQGLATVKKSSFNPIRKSAHYFKYASMEEKNEIIKKDSAFGRIICRCETVTEGEILYAIRTNPKPRDLDGIKRRTRAQMGRCQGGFCSPYITEILARELNIPVEKVTKCGGKSIINTGKTKEDTLND